MAVTRKSRQRLITKALFERASKIVDQKFCDVQKLVNINNLEKVELLI